MKNSKKRQIKIFALLFTCAIFFSCAAYALPRLTHPLRYKKEIFAAAEEFSLPASLLFAVALTESGLRKDAVSRAGAIGVMQILPETAAFIAEQLGVANYDLFSPEENVRFGAWYITYLLKRFEEETEAVLAAYNAGEGNVRAWLADERYSLDGRTLTAIPFPETAAYVKKVLAAQKKYLKLYAQILDKPPVIVYNNKAFVASVAELADAYV